MASHHLIPKEADGQATILAVASLHGWRHAHFHDSRRQVRPGVFVGDKDAKGYPDLTLVRDRLIVAELKRKGEKPRPDQVDWLDALAQAGVETYLWTLDDLDDISSILAKRWWYEPCSQRLRRLAADSDGDPDDWWQPRSIWIAGHGRRFG